MAGTSQPMTEQEIIEAPVTGMRGRTRREDIEKPRVKKGAKLEVRFIVDVSGSNGEKAAPDSDMTKQELIIGILPGFVRLLENDDAQAAREQSGGSSDKGGCRTFYANEPDPILFKEGEDESDDERDGGDLNTANINEKLAQIPWGGRTYLMPAITAAEHAGQVEAARLPEGERWDAEETLIVTDGKVSDSGPFEAWLAHRGPRSVCTVAIIGYGPGHDEAVEHYEALADSNAFLTYVALTGVSSPEEAVLDLRLLSGTAPAS
jgi:hypothetical protein